MAARDLRRYRGRNLLVFVMVAVPVGLLVGMATFAASSQASTADRVPVTLGTAQALLQGPDAGPILQGPDPSMGMSMGSGDPGSANARPVPGFSRELSLGHDTNVAAVSRLVDAPVVRVGEMPLRFALPGDKSRQITHLVLDAAPGLGQKATLLSGRWASTPSEVVVTSYGLHRGLPAQGEVTLLSQGKKHPVTVVGTANVFNSWGGQPELVSPRPVISDATYSWSWLVMGEKPVTYDDVRRLNTYGFQVISAHVLANPPAPSELPQEISQMTDYQAQELRMVVGLGALMLFVVTTLLVAPAFAVSASRQRRALALAASNGAEVRQLRRTVLAQALLLGVASSVVAAVGAVLLTLAGLTWWEWTRPWSPQFLDVPTGGVAFVVLCAVVSALVAALLPAARLGRLDIVGVMRGQSVSPGLNRVLPVLGTVLAVGGGAGLLWAVRTKQPELPVVVAGLALVVGALMLVPLLLVIAGRLAGRMPVAARMATRDAARHRMRSGPTVAAIMAGTVALTIFATGLASDTRQREREYQPQLPHGLGTLHVYNEGLTTGPDGGPGMPPKTDLEPALSMVERLTPHLVAVPFGRIQGFGGQPGEKSPFAAAVPPGCTPAQAVAPPMEQGQRCTLLGTTSMQSIGILPAADIAAVGELDSEQRKVVEAGGIMVSQRQLVHPDGRVVLVHGSTPTDPNTGMNRLDGTERRESLPAVVGSLPLTGSQIGALVTPETAARLGLPSTAEMLLLRDPEGEVSLADQEALQEQVADSGHVYVERGFQREDAIIMAVLFGGFGLLVLIVTLISTALSLAEQRADLGTFAAMGATRGTRRRLAAAQAMTVGFIGALLGVAVGLVPGIAVTYPLTSQTWDVATGIERTIPPTIVIPWLPLAAVVLGVPLLAGLLSAAAIRQAPTMTRRAD